MPGHMPLRALSQLRRMEKGGARQVLVVDEFGSLLDPVTREAMAYVFARAVERRAVDKCVVLAVNDARLLPWLQPSWVFNVDACEYRFAARFLDVKGVRAKLQTLFRVKNVLNRASSRASCPRSSRCASWASQSATGSGRRSSTTTTWITRWRATSASPWPSSARA